MSTITKFARNNFALATVIAVAFISSFFIAIPLALADANPVSCSSNGVGLSLTVFRADGTTPVGGGSITPGETVKYEATLSHLGGTNCNYEGGTLSITTPDGVAHVVASPATPVVPLVSSGSPFVSSQVSYVANSANAAGDNDFDAAADYSGGISHTGEQHDTASAHVDVAKLFAKLSPAISTIPSAGGPIGTVLNDTATLTGGSSPTGNVTFRLFAPSDATCSAAAVYTEVDPSAPYATSPGYTSLVAGTYRWTADYAGDANNNPASSGCQEEQVTITKASPGIQTTPSAGGAIGGVLNDTATVTGGSSPTGNVTFKLFPPSDAACSGAPVYEETDGTAPYATSPGYTSLVAGTYRWTADYAGDANNNPASSGCQDEQVVVGKASPTISTTPSAGGPIGTVLNDTATLSGGSSPTGNVTFKLFPPSDTACEGTPVFSQVDGIAPYATGPGYTSLVAGTYHWTADYAGDDNNNPASSGCTEEPVVIGKASPTISTTPSAGGPIGTVLNDTAMLSGGSSPTGNVTFKLFAPGDTECSAAAVYTEVDASAPYATSPGYTSLVAGTYRWTADYAGDANNNPASSGCEEEQVVIGKFTPSISTVLSTTTTSTSTPVHDTATLSGASADAGGTATYSVFTNSACTAGIRSAGVKTVVNGIVPNSDPLVFATPGTYYWQVEYSGDAKNEPATSSCRSEILVVVAPPPTGCEVDWKPVGSGWVDFAPVVYLNKGGRLLNPNNPCPFKYPLDYSPGPVKPQSRSR